MRKIVLLITALLIVSTAHAGWITVTGKVENALAETVEIIRITNFVNKQEKIYTATLNANGEFSVDMEVFTPQYIQIKHSNYFKASAFAAPENNFHVTFDCVSFTKTISYTGKGGADNNFMAQYFLKYEDTEAWNNYLMMCKSHDPAKFRETWEAQIQEELAYLDTYGQSHELSSAFKVWMADHIRYKNTNQMWDYQFNHAWENNIEVVDFQVPASYFTFFDDFKANNDYLASSPAYNRFITNFIWHIYSLDLEARGMVGFEQFNIRMGKEISLVKKNLTGYARDKQYSQIMYEILEKNEKALFESYYRDYKSIVKDELLKFVIEVKGGQVEAKNNGEVMPQGAKEIIVVDNEGNTIPFKDLLSLYAGNVIYIDMWASWCAPCIQEMPSSLILQEQFQGKSVKFLYLSQDEEDERWRKAISKHSITGDHVRMSREMVLNLSGQFNIGQIPRYMMVNKQGQIVSADASSPSDPKTVEAIKELLK